MDNLKLALTIPEAAEALRVSVPQIYKMLKGGSLPSVRIGGRRVIRIKDLETWLDANTHHEAVANG